MICAPGPAAVLSRPIAAAFPPPATAPITARATAPPMYVAVFLFYADGLGAVSTVPAVPTAFWSAIIA
jgi:hypothetical protein